MWVEENTTKGETLTADTAVEKIQYVLHNDSMAGTFDGIEGMSGELYSYLVAATTDEALGVVKAVEAEMGLKRGTAQEIQPKNYDEDDAGVDGVHVSEGGKGGGIGGGNNGKGSGNK